MSDPFLRIPQLSCQPTHLPVYSSFSPVSSSQSPFITSSRCGTLVTFRSRVYLRALKLFTYTSREALVFDSRLVLFGDARTLDCNHSQVQFGSTDRARSLERAVHLSPAGLLNSGYVLDSSSFLVCTLTYHHQRSSQNVTDLVLSGVSRCRLPSARSHDAVSSLYALQWKSNYTVRQTTIWFVVIVATCFESGSQSAEYYEVRAR